MRSDPRGCGRAQDRVLGGRAHGELVHVGAADHHGARRPQLLDRRRRVGRDEALEDLRGAGGGLALEHHVVLDRQRNARRGAKRTLAPPPRIGRRGVGPSALLRAAAKAWKGARERSGPGQGARRRGLRRADESPGRRGPRAPREREAASSREHGRRRVRHLSPPPRLRSPGGRRRPIHLPDVLRRVRDRGHPLRDRWALGRSARMGVARGITWAVGGMPSVSTPARVSTYPRIRGLLSRRELARHAVELLARRGTDAAPPSATTYSISSRSMRRHAPDGSTDVAAGARLCRRIASPRLSEPLRTLFRLPRSHPGGHPRARLDRAHAGAGQGPPRDAREGVDLIVKAQTGSGKTGAFGIPVVADRPRPRRAARPW